MSKFDSPEFDVCKEFISAWHQKGVDWELIRFLTSNKARATQNNLMNQLEDREIDGWPALSIDEWFELFEETRLNIESSESTSQDQWAGVSAGMSSLKELKEATSSVNSCWSRYKYKLRHKAGFAKETVDAIEAECEWIVRHLRSDTQNEDSVKGLVVGNVQSGKTANMAGVIAMAADMGFNFFIVLSGLISNLREQTAERLYADLALLDGNADALLNMNWRVLSNPNPKCPTVERLCSLDLTEMKNGVRNTMRYLTVCLKNKKRLRDLLGWLQSQDALEKTGLLKVLIIDDECDQAGVNTADVAAGDQTRIFQLIKGLSSHGRPGQHDSVVAGTPYLAANYIAYSATPYANILNDGDPKTSLYPRDFICSLPMSRSYWGPSRFFGGVENESLEEEFPDMPFVREITDDDLKMVKAIHDKKSLDIPNSLKRSVDWFLCCGAVRRYCGSKTPVSMLIHTSNKTCDHASVAKVVEQHLITLSKGMKSNKDIVMTEMKDLYSSEKSRFDAASLAEMFPDYEARPGAPVKDLPEFEEIWPMLSELLVQDIEHIKVADETKSQKHDFGYGVHLCVDNSCSGAVVVDENGCGITMRIKYPEAKQELSVAPLFIVVGGNTLSRGLTLQGLVSSYFVRTVRQSDSLMQMGRWFGYRFGYELLPRVWMSSSTLAKFVLLNQVDLDLRRSLRDAMESDLPPSQMVPCIRDTSDVISRFTLSSPKKMQMAEVAQEDFGGQHRVMSAYDIDLETLTYNKTLALSFLNGIGCFNNAEHKGSANFYSPGVQWGSIKEFLSNYRISSKGKDFQRLDLLFNFVETRLLDRNWTVIVAGNSGASSGGMLEFANGLKIGKIGRDVNRAEDGYVSFKHITAPADFVTDINYEKDCVSGTEPFSGKRGQANVGYYRKHAKVHGKDKAPLLIVNCISSDWLKTVKGREITEDIIGVALYIPSLSDGQIGSYTKLRVSNMVVNEEPDSEV